MSHFLAYIIAWLNVPVNAASRFLLGYIAVLPGWLSNTIISAVTGVFLLIIFKYTSNQNAIARVRDDIKAHLLAMKLFKDSIVVTLRAEGRVFKGALLLIVHAVRPMLVMIVPVCLLLAQMGLWYQQRPLLPGEETIITMELSGDIDAPWPAVVIEPTEAAEVVLGPVRVFSKRQICWKIKAVKDGNHVLDFRVDGQSVVKELAVGESFMRVSAQRPGWRWSDILWSPWEEPFRPDSPVQSISIDYPDRISRTSGADWWVIYFFIVSCVFAFLFKPFLKVKI